MSNKHGDFIWYELMTSDADAAQCFYSGLVGWQFNDSGMPGMSYLIGSVGEQPVLGLMELDDDMQANGARPMWAGYVGVDDVDATVRAVSDAGGSLLMAARDVPEVGRFALVADPQGVPIYVMRGSSDASSNPFARYEPQEGLCAWNELLTTDPDDAKRFYAEVFGWQKSDDMDMGAMGLYEMWQQDDYTIGAVMNKPDDMPMPMWNHYFRVPDIDIAVQYTKDHGGEVMTGPMQIPGGEWIIIGLDPQGAMFTLIGRQAA